MSRAGFKHPGASNEPAPDPESKTQEIKQPEVTPEEVESALLRAENLSIEIDRFSGLSSELTALLSLFFREIKPACEQLTRIRAAVDLKKKELKNLHGIEVSVDALGRLTAEHQRQKETLERLLADQRAQRESERARREREEKEYAENLRIRREREEEEYRQRWAAEKLKAQQKLEEEMRITQQESLKKQQALERDCLERELALKEKELEWVQLIQELEQFMSKLTRRTQAQTTARLEPVAGDQQDRKDSDGDDITSLKEMLVSQGRRIENLKQ